MSADSAELEALFDSIVSEKSTAPAPAAPAAPVSPPGSVAQNAGKTANPAELEAIFGSMTMEAEKARAIVSGNEDENVWEGQQKVFQRVGLMARQLHDTLRELGYDKLLQETAAPIVDAKDRLSYIANLTERAAYRVLNATDIANPIQDALEGDAATLAERWDQVFANKTNVDEFKKLATDTRAFLGENLPQKTNDTKAQLLEIMMAQDFQDLTGQVIKKVISLAQDLENQLMNVLIETIPGERRTESLEGLLNGPVINADGRSDVVVNQEQVDDLLGSLGF
ncbi:MAG: protein phosphatase CheZ [Betaproteobacteria bacterium]|nr:protein phosphatase CheZ [Betaproteobacteria bacterium]